MFIGLTNQKDDVFYVNTKHIFYMEWLDKEQCTQIFSNDGDFFLVCKETPAEIARKMTELQEWK